MEDYEPALSFDEDVAEAYDDTTERGDESAAVAFIASSTHVSVYGR